MAKIEARKEKRQQKQEELIGQHKEFYKKPVEEMVQFDGEATSKINEIKQKYENE